MKKAHVFAFFGLWSLGTGGAAAACTLHPDGGCRRERIREPRYRKRRSATMALSFCLSLAMHFDFILSFRLGWDAQYRWLRLNALLTSFWV